MGNFWRVFSAGGWERFLQPHSRVRIRQLAITVAVLLTLFPAPALAQQQEFIKDNLVKLVRKIGIQVNVSTRKFEDDVTKPRVIGASVVLGGSRKEGWKFPVALTSFTANLHSPSGAQFGSLRSWAVVGGIGYGWNFGKLSTGVGLETGVAFNSGRLDGNAAEAFAVEGPVSIHVGNSLVLRPRVRAEYFITHKFTVHASTGYVLTRPSVLVTTPTGTVADRWNASHFSASVGIGFYPFRK